MKSFTMASAVLGATLGAVLALGATDAAAKACVTKAANATAGSESSAKWFVMETMVQSVSWSLWPGFLANNKVEGYTVSYERYSCKPDGGSVFCRGSATFCKKG